MKTNKGFTLIELMVVILIIGILSAIALPEYTRSMEKARVAEALTIMDSIKKGVDVYAAENGMFDYQELIGNEGTGAAKALDINIENELSCTVASGEMCRGKYFDFDAWCGSGECFIYAYRSDYNNPTYTLYMTKGSDLRWTRICYVNSTETGDQICEMLKGQGWDKQGVYQGY